MHFPLSEQIKFLSGVVQLTKNQIVLTQSLSTPYHRLRRRIKGIFLSSSPAAYPINNQELKELLAGAGLIEIKRYRPCALSQNL